MSWFFSGKNGRVPGRKMLIKSKKGPVRTILITPQRRYEREKQHSLHKKKRHRVHFFMPKSKSIFSLHIVEPTNIVVKRWLGFMVFPLVYEVWAFPYRLSLSEPSMSSRTFVMDVIIDFIMLVGFL